MQNKPNVKIGKCMRSSYLKEVTRKTAISNAKKQTQSNPIHGRNTQCESQKTLSEAKSRFHIEKPNFVQRPLSVLRQAVAYRPPIQYNAAFQQVAPIKTGHSPSKNVKNGLNPCQKTGNLPRNLELWPKISHNRLNR
jgi:hypothetical protein